MRHNFFFINTCVSVHVYICVCVCVYIYIYIYVEGDIFALTREDILTDKC